MVKLMYSSGRESNMFYQMRMEIPDPFFFLDMGENKYIFLDHREFGAFEEANQNPTIQLVALESLYEEIKNIPGDGPGAGKLATVILKKYGIEKEEIVIPSTFPVSLADYLRSQGIILIPQSSLYPERIVKSADEIQAIRDSLLRTQSAFKKIEEILEQSKIRDGKVVCQGSSLTSEYLKVEAEKVLLEQDMVNVEGIIISSGPHAAIPHHRGSGEILAGSTIVCDIFPRHRATGFFADMTRTYVKGEPSSDVRKMYNTVLEIQTKAIERVKPGVSFGEIHLQAVEEFIKRGYHKGPEGFTHSIGHGLGLDVHELPFAGKGDILEPGHVITIEPGLYYRALGGVRIEDVVLVTETGCESLAQYPNRFIIT